MKIYTTEDLMIYKYWGRFWTLYHLPDTWWCIRFGNVKFGWKRTIQLHFCSSFMLSLQKSSRDSTHRSKHMTTSKEASSIVRVHFSVPRTLHFDNMEEAQRHISNPVSDLKYVYHISWAVQYIVLRKQSPLCIWDVRMIRFKAKPKGRARSMETPQHFRSVT